MFVQVGKCDTSKMAGENEDAGQRIAPELSDSGKVEQWAIAHKLSPETVKLLFRDGFTSMEAIELIEWQDFESTKIPTGQRKLIMKALGQWKPGAGMKKGAADKQAQASDVSALDQSLSSRPNTRSGSGTSSDRGTQQGGQDSYISQVLGSLMQQQNQHQEAENGHAVGMGASADSGIQSSSLPSLVGIQASGMSAASNMAAPMISTGPTMATWNDPQLHITTAAGKAPSSFLDITDYVSVAGATHEEVIVDTDRGPQLIFRSGARKPKLESVSIPQWSVANLAILHTLMKDLSYDMNDVTDYLSYTTHICQLFQRFHTVSVLFYDREYRKAQAQHRFRWGTEMPHLQICFLHSKSWGNGKQQGGPQRSSNGQGGSSSVGNQHKKGPVTTDGKEICRLFNSVKGCSYNNCRYQHVCSVPSCGDKHSAVHHEVTKN